jgi:hypothetical protein
MDRNQLLNDTETAIRYGFDNLQARLWTALPCIVSKVNFASMTIEAQPAIKAIQTNADGSTQNVNLPLLVDVPIVFPSAGGFTLTFPIKAGDEVLVILASRCIDDWWQSGGIGVQLDLRMHDLSDGFAIPGPKSQPNVISAISSSNLQIRTNDGTCFIEMTPAGMINILAPLGVHVTGEVFANAIPLSTHIHPDPQGGDTGAPLP